MSDVRYVFKERSFRRYYGEVPRHGTVELTVDWSLLVYHLGKKAAFNKSGRSGVSMLGIKAKFTSREHKPRTAEGKGEVQS